MTRPVMYKLDKRDIASPELCEMVYTDLRDNGPSIFDDVCDRVGYRSHLSVAAAIGILRTEDKVLQERPCDLSELPHDGKSIFEWLRLTTYSAV